VPTGSAERMEARALVSVLAHHKNLLENIPVVLTEIKGYNLNRPGFLEAVRKQLERKKQRSKLQWLDLRIMDLSQKLQEHHYYTLDDHMNNFGHAIVADEFEKLGRKIL
jgi:hypothetical protein